MPSFYHRFVDDTITTQRDLTTADAFLSTLNSCHPSISFNMEVEVDGKLPFLGIKAVRNGRHLETKIYVKPTNKGLLLHYDSHVDERYKRSLLKTMLHRAFRLSSSWKYFTEECERLNQLFRRLLVDNTIAKFIAKKNEHSKPAPADETRKQSILRIVLSFKDQKSANIVRRQLNDLGTRIGIIFQPVYVSKKLESALHVPGKKPPLVNQQCVVYKFKCDLCDADYVGYT